MNNRLYINYRTPKEIEIIIKKSVRGQDEGVKTVATALSAHLLRIRYAQSHPGRELQSRTGRQEEGLRPSVWQATGSAVRNLCRQLQTMERRKTYRGGLHEKRKPAPDNLLPVGKAI